MIKYVAVTTLGLMLAGCGGDSGGNSGGNEGSFSLAFSDAPVDGLDKVCVAFDKITVKHVNGAESSWGSVSFAADQSSKECIPSGHTIPKDSNGNPEFMVINLLAYQGAKALQVLSEEKLEAGQYSQMRLSVLSTWDNSADLYPDGTPYSHVREIITGDVYDIRVPSGELKLDGFDVTANATQAYTLEFDLRKSMVSNAHGYQLKPRGLRLVKNENVATLQGTVESGSCAAEGNLNKAYIYVYQPRSDDNYGDLGSSTEPFTSAKVDATPGKYTIGYLPLGNYDIALACDGAADDPEKEEGASAISLMTPVYKNQALTTTGLTLDVKY
ncbi:hypothetical protein A3K86_19670 [Photobacterium jeanii]|uniref:DUF4382 domain-containing protein n=1 Tax=Photobacterium jeanii TaxID=858640 RepID=A0A178K386_9GAMM|nr:DUF4382 domain-containing protein [Photobacterium jeanii]OAN11182.1 hypothetical protein A3K86_19670 [Photobacterium jeanii]PST90701.1 DUF4382 domain-containing protein [Photobacterium jeanii]